MELMQELLRWADTKGVEMSGIKPQEMPGRGIGIVATRTLQAGETILEVPIQALRSLNTMPESIVRKLPPDFPLHGLLAAELALDKTLNFEPWNAVIPKLADFEASVPFLWPEELQGFLPKPAKDILTKLQAKFKQEWDIIAKVFPDIRRSQYLYTWLIVNTRTFYYVTPEMEKFPHEDRLALLPVADLFNHADSGCQVSFSTERFVITVDRTYHSDEEVCISYGGHSNDFLLTEYGFVLATNRWDGVCLDDVILPNLTRTQKVKLEESDFLGNYMIDFDTAGCHRTQVVLRLLCCTQRQWRSFINGEDDGEASQGKADALLLQLLERFVVAIGKTRADIEELNVGQDTQRELLAQRWRQIETLVTHTIIGLKASQSCGTA